MAAPSPEHDTRVAEARERVDQPGDYVVYEDSGQLRIIPLTREWTRIGRSLAADVRFDDPTVSRRHALIVRQPDGVRLLDDRSLNGVFVNGTRVDGRTLSDGDEIVVGRYRLLFLSVPAIEAETRRPASRTPACTRLASRGERLPRRPAAAPAVRSIGSMTLKIAVLSQKGGTGKTTTVRTLTDVLRRCGVSTLAVDLDPQGNLSEYFDLPPDVEPTIAEVLTGGSSAAEAIREDIIPANLSLAEAELMLGGKMGRELTLRRALAKGLDAYDVILIDCPPSLGLLTVNALVAADHALITAEAQYFALQGVEQAMEVVELARENLNPDLELLGVLLNLADMRTVHSREALASLKERFGDSVFDTVIRASIAYAESAERARSILDHRPDLGADYTALAAELLERLPELERRRPARARLRRELAQSSPT